MLVFLFLPPLIHIKTEWLERLSPKCSSLYQTGSGRILSTGWNLFIIFSRVIGKSSKVPWACSWFRFAGSWVFYISVNVFTIHMINLFEFSDSSHLTSNPSTNPASSVFKIYPIYNPFLSVARHHKFQPMISHQIFFSWLCCLFSLFIVYHTTF